MRWGGGGQLALEVVFGLMNCSPPSLSCFTVGPFLISALPSPPHLWPNHQILGILQNVFSVKLGFGLGSVAFVFHVADCVLRRVSGRNDSFNSAAAGFIAGLGFISIRSSSIALYLLGKAAEALYWEAHERGLVPTHPHGDVFLYSISGETHM